MRHILNLIVFVVLALIMIPAINVHAQDPVSVGLISLAGDRVVKDILKDADDKVQKLIDRAGARGELLVQQLTSQLQLAIANLKISLAESENKFYDTLDADMKAMFVNINRTISKIEQGGVLRNLTELAALDVREIVNRLIISQPKQEFYVSSIRGMTLASQPHDYIVTVTGLGFGFAGNSPPCAVDVFIDGQQLDFLAIRQTENHQVFVTVPSSMMQSKFEDNKLSYAWMTFQSTIGGGRSSRKYQVKVPFILLPKNSGRITVDEVVQEDSWKPETDVYRITLTRKTEGEPSEQFGEWTCAENQEILDASYIPPVRDAGFCYSLRYRGTPKEYAADFEILPGKRTIKVYRFMIPCVCGYDVVYRTKHKTSKQNTVKENLPIQFGQRYEVELSSNNGNGNFRVRGSLFDGNPIFSNSEIAPSEKDSLLKLIGIGKVGDHYRLTFELSKPWVD